MTLTSFRFFTVYPGGRVPFFSIAMGQRLQAGFDEQHFCLGFLGTCPRYQGEGCLPSFRSRWPVSERTMAGTSTEALNVPRGYAMPTLSGRVQLVLVSLVAVLLTALPATAQVGGEPPADTTAAASSTPARSTTLVGVVREYAGITPSGSGVHHFTLHTDVGTFDLVAPGLELPPTGTEVAATGTLTDTTFTATAVRVLARPPARLRGTTVARKTRVTKSLVMRVYWKGGAPAKPTTAATKEAFLTDSNRWFQEVSAGNYGVKGKVTPWLKISRKPSCLSPDNTAMRQALAKAKKKGFDPKKFSRYVLYLPCGGKFVAGYANLPGKNVWMFRNLSRSVIMHEQGHNLGLHHANYRSCRKSGLVTTFSGTCSTFEYADPFDAMGNRSAGHFSAFNKARLGWAKTRTLTASGTQTLAPYVGGGGVKGLRVKVSNKLSYWLEYRTAKGLDAGFATPGSYGVQIRRVAGPAPEIVDARPESGEGWDGNTYVDEIDGASLAVGSSVTTPEGIRLQVVSQNDAGATVKVTFKAGAAKAPAAPTGVTADPGDLDSGAIVTWNKPDDRGAVISRYVVTASPGDVTKNVRPTGAAQQSVNLTGLTTSQTTITVKAVNEAGTSAGGSTTVTPVAVRPVVSITSPANGSVFTEEQAWDGIPVQVSATVGGGKSIEYVELLVDGDWTDSSWSAPYDLFWYPWSGTYTLTVVAYDSAQKSTTSAPVTVTITE